MKRPIIDARSPSPSPKRENNESPDKKKTAAP